MTSLQASQSPQESKGIHPGIAALGMLLTLVAGYIVGVLNPKPWPFSRNTQAGGEEDIQTPVREAAPPAGLERFKVKLGTSPMRGAQNAKVTIVEFSDYQCPFCGKAENIISQLLTQYPDTVRLVYKQNPLSFHDKARPASYAALAAREQGEEAFWKFHALLFQNQTQLDDAHFEQWAKQSGLNVEKFNSDYKTKRSNYDQIIQADQDQANLVAAGGTPHFFINGRRVKGAKPIAEFQKIIDEEIQVANQVLAKGATYKNLYATLLQNGLERAQQQAQPQPQLKAQAEFQVPTEVYKVPLGNAPVRGNAKALVTIVQYSDFQCPFCAKVETTMDQLLAKYGDKLRIAFKQNPLSFHPNAEPAAEASLAAHKQGKFWEMHRKLFAAQDKLDRASLEQYAQELKLNVDQFKEDLDKSAYKEIIQQDQQEAQRLGARGTPAAFINGRFVPGARDIEDFKKVIDFELARLEQKRKAGESVKYDDVIKDGLTQAPSPSQPATALTADGDKRYKVDLGSSPTKGPTNAKVTVVIFSDFQCPFCSRVVEPLHEIEKAYPKEVRFVFKQLPLPFHPNALPAAEASLAAHEQGKFWPMHDKLFANQEHLQRADLERYAQEIGLDLNRFRTALDTGKWKSQILKETAEAENTKVVRGTPGFLINGRFVGGAKDFAGFKALIDQALQEADALMKEKKIPASAVYAELMKNVQNR